MVDRSYNPHLEASFAGRQAASESRGIPFPRKGSSSLKFTHVDVFAVRLDLGGVCVIVLAVGHSDPILFWPRDREKKN